MRPKGVVQADGVEHRSERASSLPITVLTVIRFGRAKGRCEDCGRPHGREPVVHLGDGRWWDEEAASWRDGAGGLV